MFGASMTNLVDLAWLIVRTLHYIKGYGKREKKEKKWCESSNDLGNACLEKGWQMIDFTDKISNGVHSSLKRKFVFHEHLEFGSPSNSLIIVVILPAWFGATMIECLQPQFGSWYYDDRVINFSPHLPPPFYHVNSVSFLYVLDWVIKTTTVLSRPQSSFLINDLVAWAQLNFRYGNFARRVIS